jgi:hypothetical protein
MTEIDDLDLNFDDDLGGDFGNLEMDVDSPTQDRNPVSVVSGKALDTVVTKLTDKDLIREQLKKALPKDYATTVEFGEQTLDGLDKAKNNLVNPIRKEIPNLKRNLNKLTPMIDRVLGKTAGEKFSGWTATEDRAGSATIDPVQAEIQGVTATLLGGWTEQQEGLQSRQLVQKMLDDQTEEGRFKTNFEVAASTELAVRKLVSFNETIGVEYYKQSIGMDIKKLHILKSMLELQTTSFGAQITELRNVTKNTGLPELVKQRNSELFTQMVQENWYGRTADSVTDFGRDYFQKWMGNVGTWAKDKGEAIGGQMSEMGNLAEMLGDMEESRADMGGPETSKRDTILNTATGAVVGGGINKLMGKGRDKLKEYLSTNEGAKVMAEKLALFNTNRISTVNDSMDNYSGVGSELLRWLRELAPTLSDDREGVESSLKDNLTAKAQWDMMQRESVVTIIPGWLSRIHEVLKRMSGDGSGRETYDILSRKFTTEKEATTKALESLVTKDEKESITAVLTSLIEELGLDKDETLYAEAKTAFRDVLVDQARNNPELNLNDLLSNERLSPELKASLNDTLNKGGAEVYGNFSTELTSDVRNTRLKAFGAFKQLGKETTDLQSRLNVLDKGGQQDLLRNLGLLNLDGTLDHSKLAETLYREDGGVSGYEAPPIPPTTVNAPTTADYNTPPITTTVTPQVDPSAVPTIVTVAPVLGDEFNNALTGITKFHETYWDKVDDRFKGVTGKPSEEAINRYVDITSRIDGTNNLLSEFLAAYMAKADGEGFSVTGTTGGVKAMLSGALGSIKTVGKGYMDLSMGLFNRGKSAALGSIDGIGRVLKGFSGAFRAPSDIYVVGGDAPAIFGKDISKGIYFNWVDGHPSGEAIKSVDDIKGPIFNVEAEAFVISQEDYDKGLYIRNNGLMEKIGNGLGNVLKMITNPWAASIGLMTKGLSAANDLRKRGIKFITDKFNKARDIFDADGNLVASAEDILSGKLFYMKDGKQVWITNLKDLMAATGAVYTTADGEPRVLISKSKMEQGLRDIKGKAIEIRSFLGGLGTKAFNFAGKAAGLVAKVYTAPLKLLRSLGKKLMDGFDKRMVKAMFVDLPDNLVFRTNTVHIYADVVNGGVVEEDDKWDDPDGTRPFKSNYTKAAEAEARSTKANDTDPIDTTPNFKGDDSTVTKIKDAITKGRDITTEEAKAAFAKLNEKLNLDGKSVNETMDSVKATVIKAREDAAKEAEAAYNKLKDKLDYEDGDLSTAEALEGVKAAINKSREEATKEAKGLFEKLGKKLKPATVRGDSDGDGLRDGGWKAKLKEWKDKKAEKSDSKAETGKEESKGGLGKIIGLLSGLVGLVGTGFGFLKDFGASMFKGSKFIKMLGNLVTAGSAAGTVATAGTVAGGIGATTAAGTAAGGTAAAAAGVTKRQAIKAAVKLAVKKVAVKGGVAVAGAVVAGVVGAPVIAIALSISAAAWTAWEIGSSIYGYFARRSNMSPFEMGRFLQYGYYTGGADDYETRKVALRYFESEMLDRIVTDDKGRGVLNETPSELWEEYAGDLGGNDEDEDERLRFAEWYNHRFKPVLFRWITAMAGYKEEYDDITLNSIDEELPRKEWPNFVNAIFDFSPLKFDPLEGNSGASSAMPIQARRKEARAFFDTNILKIEDKEMNSTGKPEKFSESNLPAATDRGLRSMTRIPTRGKLAGIRPTEDEESVPNQPFRYSGLSSNDDSAYSPGTSYRGNVIGNHEPDIVDERLAKYDDLINRASQRHGVAVGLIRNVIRTESAGVATAKSGVGAAGLMQLMPGTAAEVGVNNRFDPGQNINGGTAYLKKKLNEFDGDPKLALAAYNAGAGNVKKAIRLAGSNDADQVLAALPRVTGRHSKETINYVERISSRYDTTINANDRSPQKQDVNGGTFASVQSDGDVPVDDESENLKMTHPARTSVSTALKLAPKTETVAFKVPSLPTGEDSREAAAVVNLSSTRVAEESGERLNLTRRLVEVNELQLIQLESLNALIAKNAVAANSGENSSPTIVTPTTEPTLAKSTPRAPSRGLELSVNKQPGSLKRTV